MRRSLRIIASFVFVASLNILASGAHAMLPSSSANAMSGKSHAASSSNCAMLCAVATVRKEDILKSSSEEEDDGPSTPFYIELQQSLLTALEKKHSERTKLAVEFEPPPGSPAYIQLAVFRA